MNITSQGSIDGIKCSLSQNWPKKGFEVHLNCLMDSANHYNTTSIIKRSIMDKRVSCLQGVVDSSQRRKSTTSTKT